MQSSIKLLCGDALILATAKEYLISKGVFVCDSPDLTLLLDKPLGWAILSHPNMDWNSTVILTENQCATYQLVLLDKKPKALLPFDLDYFISIADSLKTGRAFYPNVVSPLTLAERKVLYWVALGKSNHEISELLTITEQTAKNCIGVILKKLNLNSRVQLSFYFFGNWHLIENWSPPDFS
jgi:DNA-binding CsgD family transcriptional regulator